MLLVGPVPLIGLWVPCRQSLVESPQCCSLMRGRGPVPPYITLFLENFLLGLQMIQLSPSPHLPG